MKTWRCFHCDEGFRSRRSAQDHFGLDYEEQELPACVDPLRYDEEKRLTQLREARELLDTYFTLEDPTTVATEGVELWVKGELNGVPLRGMPAAIRLFQIFAARLNRGHGIAHRGPKDLQTFHRREICPQRERAAR